MAFKKPRFSQGQTANMDRQGGAEFKKKKRRKPAPKAGKMATAPMGPIVPQGGMAVGF